MAEEPEYLTARVHGALTEDRRIGGLELAVSVSGDLIVIHGEVPSEDRKAAIRQIVEEVAPEFRVRVEVRVSQPKGAPTHERLE